MKIDWKRKLTSRKWWISVAVLICGLVQMFGFSEQIVSQISGTIMAVASVVAYTIGEGLADSTSLIEIKKEEDSEDEQSI